jgi:hypothetical protein
MAKASMFFVMFSVPTTLAAVTSALRNAGFAVQATNTGTLDVSRAGVALEIGLSME